MKKIVAIILTVCLIAILCACGKNYSTTEPQVPTKVPTTEIASLAPTENKKELAKENYLKILQWLAERGTPQLEEKDVNNYGRLNGYKYNGFSFDVDADGNIATYKSLVYCWTEDKPNNEYIDHYISIDVGTNTLYYSWLYRDGPWSSSTLAKGTIYVSFNEVTNSQSNHKLKDYTELKGFREHTGYNDVRSVINEGFDKTIMRINTYLKNNIGVSLNDIGFTQYSK